MPGVPKPSRRATTADEFGRIVGSAGSDWLNGLVGPYGRQHPDGHRPAENEPKPGAQLDPAGGVVVGDGGEVGDVPRIGVGAFGPRRGGAVATSTTRRASRSRIDRCVRDSIRRWSGIQSRLWVASALR